MTKDILFSIIIPSYNQGHFIDKCLQSIVTQSYQEYEVIIQDNLSNDNTKFILQKYKSHKNIQIYYEKDYGQADAINKGLKKAKGEWVTWMNCDDYYNDNNIFNIFYNEIIKPKNISKNIFYGNMTLSYFNKSVPDYTLNYCGVNLFTLIFEGSVISNQSCFWRSDLNHKYGYLRNFYNSFDYEWFLRIAKKNKFSKLPTQDPISTFLIHKDQKSFKYSEYDEKLRKKILEKYRGKFLSNFIILAIMNKISKIFRLACLIYNGDLFYFIKKKSLLSSVKNFFFHKYY